MRTGLVDTGLGRAVVRVFVRGAGTIDDGPKLAPAAGGEGRTSGLPKPISGGVVPTIGGKSVPSDPREEVEEGWVEDRRVVWAALAAVCNLVVDFSPLRAVRSPLFHPISARVLTPWRVKDMLTDEALGRLVTLVSGRDGALRVNALWALKNLLWKASSDVKRAVMARVGWPVLVEYVAQWISSSLLHRDVCA